MSEAEGRRAGVCGWPVAHSRSPLIHRYWLRTLGLAGSYDRFAISVEGFSAFTASIGRDQLVGANVTAPHKEAAFAVCDRLTAAAQATGAVNTLWRENGALCGDNTDIAGFLDNLDEGSPGWAANVRSAVVLGAGGAARAIVYALRLRGVERVTIVNRSRERAAVVAAGFAFAALAASWDDLPRELEVADLVVNATTLGMAGQPPLVVDLAPLKSSAIVCDIVYVPLATPLIDAARARGLRAVEGLGMLLHQAVPGFKQCFGGQPIVTPELRALVEADLRPAVGKEGV